MCGVCVCVFVKYKTSSHRRDHRVPEWSNDGRQPNTEEHTRGTDATRRTVRQRTHTQQMKMVQKYARSTRTRAQHAHSLTHTRTETCAKKNVHAKPSVCVLVGAVCAYVDDLMGRIQKNTERTTPHAHVCVCSMRMYACFHNDERWDVCANVLLYLDLFAVYSTVTKLCV